ncbi:MAG: hypothetical protein ACE5Q7_02880 [Candidatus Nitrosomaritimum yanchengensis]
MLSKALLENAFDYPSISRKRVENYEILNRYLSKFAIFPNLPEGVVPLAYPIRLRNREEVRQHLFKKKIYPPVHWPLSGLVPENFAASHHLSSTILSLVCDQRYSSADMIGTAELVLKEAKLD